MVFGLQSLVTVKKLSQSCLSVVKIIIFIKLQKTIIIRNCIVLHYNGLNGWDLDSSEVESEGERSRNVLETVNSFNDWIFMMECTLKES